MSGALTQRAPDASPDGASRIGEPRCLGCEQPLSHTVVDLGMHPPCESFVAPEDARAMEPTWPLRVYVCDRCFLVQLPPDVDPRAIFREYAYFSSYSSSWLEHAERYVREVTARFGLDERSFVVELASNDGYLLRNFVAAGIPALGVEPAANVARAAVAQGVPTLVEFFTAELGRRLAAERGHADLICGANVLAQVPPIHDFLEGVRALLAPRGVFTFEFPHLLRMIESTQFDTVYHEHYLYLSLLSLEPILARHGLRLFDVEELATHGGSLRVYGTHAGEQSHADTPRVDAVRRAEAEAGLATLDGYRRFAERVRELKHALLTLLIELRRAGKHVVAYGAAGKGNTLLNYCGIGPDLVEYVVDRNPYKQGRLLPGSRIPIHPPARLRETRPDYVLLLPWNLRDEILLEHAYVSEWGGRFIVPIPRPEVVDPVAAAPSRAVCAGAR
jgi:hypothetical protein